MSTQIQCLTHVCDVNTVCDVNEHCGWRPAVVCIARWQSDIADVRYKWLHDVGFLLLRRLIAARMTVLSCDLEVKWRFFVVQN